MNAIHIYIYIIPLVFKQVSFFWVINLEAASAKFFE